MRAKSREGGGGAAKWKETVTKEGRLRGKADVGERSGHFLFDPRLERKEIELAREMRLRGAEEAGTNERGRDMKKQRMSESAESDKRNIFSVGRYLT
jgi:hypothetical protein